MQKKPLYIFPESHLVICCCCPLSVQTVGQEWQHPGAGSQNWLSGCQRKRERERPFSQVVLPVDRPAAAAAAAAAAATAAAGGGSSFHTASLNWYFQSRNVNSFGMCFVCLRFQHASRLHSRSPPHSS